MKCPYCPSNLTVIDESETERGLAYEKCECKSPYCNYTEKRYENGGRIGALE